ncbi:MAG: trehalose-6-phosphate synthase [Chloroflexi bacterium]|nr:trehalose-6-phosphate synthase [Chloroflexota bacterium]
MANSDDTLTDDETSSIHEATLQEICHRVLGERRLVIASNRGPVTYAKDENGELVAERGSGGVVTALSSLTHITPLTWVAAALSEADREISDSPEAAPLPTDGIGENLRLRFVNIDEDSFDKYLNVISNPLLWFTQHEMNDLLLEERESLSEMWVAWREGYVRANHEFARVIAEEVDLPESAPYVIFHDYQLYLAPGVLRRDHPGLTMMHFTHIPWPGPETWHNLPGTWVRVICESLLACDIVGFQTNSAVEAFAATCLEYVEGVKVARDKEGNTLVSRPTGQGEAGVTWVRAYPISIDPQEVMRVYRSPEAADWKAKLQADLGNYDKLIVRVDRLDPNKNVVAGFESYQQLLQDRPDLAGKVVFLALLVPTRESVPEYAQYKDQTFELIDQINEEFGRKNWRPVHYIYGNDYARALAALSMADVVLVNSVADGMNLVAKEGVIVSEKPSVLVLSTNTGAWEELGEHSIGVAPDDQAGTAQALFQAMEMPQPEREERHRALKQTVRENDLSHWLASHLTDLGRFHREA